MWDPRNPLEAAALELLHRLEERENPLLTWGFLEGGFTQDEVQELAQQVLDERNEFGDPAELIDLLQDRRLLFDLPGEGQWTYRTRLAEAVRLFAGLKQIFRPTQWETAPRLVADYRLAIRPRRYPPRNVSYEEALAAVQTRRQLERPEAEVFEALLRGAGREHLARFQLRAASQILHLLPQAGVGNSHATLISAGTGTGKTLAFYLPCLMAIARRLKRNEAWTQAIAIYPRNELLKDQFTEACRESRRLRGVLARPIRIGAFFGPTPHAANLPAVSGKWQAAGAGFLCPFLRCPDCESDLIWPRTDLERGRERLICVRNCGGEVSGQEVSLTRSRLAQSPPDLLFTTTEMLNRQMSHTALWPLYGLGQPPQRAPYLLLLDEVHTYSGTHGAQVGLLLRRWRHMLRHPLHVVGLSATLADPIHFFADLTGVHPGAVTVIDPGEEYEEEGKEYALVLRGDPVSGTSLLSTTIQAAMLMGRTLDPLEEGRSGDVFGSKTFLFTDDLDVTNRLYHNLLDAEARDSNQQPIPNRLPLASLRSPNLEDAQRRLREGQSWLLCQWIGHSLDHPADRLEIGRTSSQDTGVDARCEVIVATAALEVGYNDLQVGAVIQHKAPRDAASFLQRKGRAGRRRITRPWTVVVLSDYGRDRLAYQAYDQMFDPVLEKMPLPFRNRYVLRMQATYAFLEWMATLFPGEQVHIWDDCTGPKGPEGSVSRERQRREAEILRRLLVDEQARQPLAEFLGRALKISAQEVQALFWEPPRALMTAVLPTLWRRLTTGWHRVRAADDEPEQDTRARYAPLPDFIPANLFSDLNVPEVRIVTPQRPGDADDDWVMPLGQALATLPAGRVTRRFGVHHIAVSHWVAPPNLAERRQALEVNDFSPGAETIGTFHVRGAAGVEEVVCLRPWTLLAHQCPPQVMTTSNARMDWRSQIYAPDPGVDETVPQGCLLEPLLDRVSFFTHNHRCSVRVRRFAVGSQASIRFQGGRELATYIRFTTPGGERQAGVGFEQEVDGIRFVFRMPADFRLRSPGANSLRACRTAYFRYRVENDPFLLERAQENRFRLRWIGEVYLSILLSEALEGFGSLQAARNALVGGGWAERVERALNAIFQVVDVEDADEGGVGDADADVVARRGRVHDTLRQLLQEEAVRERLLELSHVLWEDEGPDRDLWLRRRLKTTLAAALLQACLQLSPQFQNGDLLLDIDEGPPPPGMDALPPGEEAIWITESVIGGGGVVEEILRRYQEDPRHFFLLVETALGPSDFERVDRELTRVVELTQGEPEVQEAFTRVRGAARNRDLRSARDALMTALSRKAVLLSHPVMTALNARLLRPGSSPLLDGLMAWLLRWWQEEEERLGVEIDMRVFAYLACARNEVVRRLDDALADIGAWGERDIGRCYGRIYGLLWPRGSIVRERSLEAYNPYAALPAVDPALLRDELLAELTRVEVTEAQWRAHVDAVLVDQGVVLLTAPVEHRSLLSQALLQIASQPVNAGFLRLHPYVARLERDVNGYTATLHLREAVQ